MTTQILRLFPYTTLFRSNFFAETLLKDLGHLVYGAGSTSAGVRAATSHAAALGARVRMIDGSGLDHGDRDRKSTRLNSSHVKISYAVFCLKKKKSKQK